MQLFIGLRSLYLLAASEAELRQAGFAALTSNGQKNAIRNGVIGLGQSGSHLLCPVLVIIHQVISLSTNGEPPGNPLGRTLDCPGFKAKLVTAVAITYHQGNPRQC